MKKVFLMAACLLGCLALNSCLEFDEPGDELNRDQVLVTATDDGNDGGGSGNDSNGSTDTGNE